MTTAIEITGLRCQAFHGVLPQEHTVGNLYEIDATIEADLTRATATDELADTINYADAVDVILAEMRKPSRLIEHVAGRIVESLRRRFPQAEGIDLRIAKLSPPIPADVKACAVHVRWQHQQN